MIENSQVATWLDLKNAGQGDAYLDLVVKATNAFIEGLPDKPVTLDAEGETVWSDSTVLAGIMLGARLYNRRNSANGIESFSEAGTSYVSRYDSDISRMLRIDGYKMPRVG